jgi:hypothetical protein
MQDRASSPSVVPSEEPPTVPGFKRTLGPMDPRKRSHSVRIRRVNAAKPSAKIATADAPTLPPSPPPAHPSFIVKPTPILIVPPELEPPPSSAPVSR